VTTSYCISTFTLHVFVTQITTQKFMLYSVDCPLGTVVPFVKWSPGSTAWSKTI